jgi:hypothetical protein
MEKKGFLNYINTVVRGIFISAKQLEASGKNCHASIKNSKPQLKTRTEQNQ